MFVASRANLPVPMLRENDTANTVAPFQHCPCEQCRRSGCQHGFEHHPATEVHGRRLIHQEQYWSFPFFLKEFGVRDPRPCCHSPINSSDIITWLINTNLGKVYAPSPEPGCHQASKGVCRFVINQVVKLS